MLYLAGATWPEIAYALKVLCRKQIQTSETNWENVKEIFRFLRGTSKIDPILKAMLNYKPLQMQVSGIVKFKSSQGITYETFGDTVVWRNH